MPTDRLYVYDAVFDAVKNQRTKCIKFETKIKDLFEILVEVPH